ncbi:hypothetical protein ACX1DX_11930 [Tessaracoccus sp. Y36]
MPNQLNVTEIANFDRDLLIRTHVNPPVFRAGQTDENWPTSLTNSSMKGNRTMKDNINAVMAHDPQQWGIDTVRVSFDVASDTSLTFSPFWTRQSSRNRPGTNTQDEIYVGAIATTGGDVRVSLYPQNNVCTLEFNAARLLHQKSSNLADPEALPLLVKTFIEKVAHVAGPTFVTIDPNGEEIWDADWQDLVRVKRLDIARNFDVASPDLVKAVLPKVQPAHGKSKVEYNSARSGWTLVNATKQSGMDRLYDKTAELATHGITESFMLSGGRQFRFEAQLQKDRLNGSGLAKLSGVTSANCWNALSKRWSATRWGSPLPSSTGLLEALSNLPDLKKRRLVGDLYLDAAGMAHEVLSPSQLKQYRAEARRLGIVPGTQVEFLGEADQHLDLEAGELRPWTPPCTSAA